MKILFILEFYFPHVGGAEKLFHSLIEELAKSGNECIILTTRHDRALPRTEQKQNITIHRINSPSRYLFTLFALPKALKFAKDCDLIHTTSYNAGFPAWLAGKMRKKQTIITFHDFWGKLWFRLPFMNPISKLGHYCFEQMLIRRSFYKIITPSGAVKHNIQQQQFKTSEIQAIYLGIDYNQYQITPTQHQDESFVFTFCGRLGIFKGLELLIPAFIEVNQKTPNTKLKLIIPEAKGKVYRWIQKKVKKAKIESSVEFIIHPEQKQLREHIQQSGCVVIPSHTEGFCYVAVETMALETPIISSHRGALAEVVGGPHISMKTLSVSALYNAMQQASKNQWEQKPPKKFPLETSVQQYIKLYDEIIQD